MERQPKIPAMLMGSSMLPRQSDREAQTLTFHLQIVGLACALGEAAHLIERASHHDDQCMRSLTIDEDAAVLADRQIDQRSAGFEEGARSGDSLRDWIAVHDGSDGCAL